MGMFHPVHCSVVIRIGGLFYQVKFDSLKFNQTSIKNYKILRISNLCLIFSLASAAVESLEIL
jgi:hypothetical protein